MRSYVVAAFVFAILNAGAPVLAAPAGDVSPPSPPVNLPIGLPTPSANPAPAGGVSSTATTTTTTTLTTQTSVSSTTSATSGAPAPSAPAALPIAAPAPFGKRQVKVPPSVKPPVSTSVGPHIKAVERDIVGLAADYANVSIGEDKASTATATTSTDATETASASATADSESASSGSPLQVEVNGRTILSWPTA